MLTDYKTRLKIPIISGDVSTRFYTKCDIPVAIGYERIVIGKRGPYIEFDNKQIIRNYMSIPETELWRVSDSGAFYIEYRTKDSCNVKIYYQKKTVDYADYKLDFFYISPFDLKTDSLDAIITPLNQNIVFDNNFF